MRLIAVVLAPFFAHLEVMFMLFNCEFPIRLDSQAQST